MLLEIILLRVLAASFVKCPKYIDILDERLVFDSVTQSYRKVQKLLLFTKKNWQISEPKKK